MPKPTTEAEVIAAHTESGGADTAEAIVAALAAAPTSPTDALSYMHTVDSDAAELWRIRGPKGTKIVEISAFVLEIDGAVKRVLSSTYADGKFKLYVEIKPEDLA